MNNNFWILLSCAFILLEIGNPGLLYFLAIAISAIFALLTSYFGYLEEIQYIVFFASSAITISCVYLFSKYISKPDTKNHKSNTDLLIGKTVIITEVQSSNIGRGKVDGEIWLIKLTGEGNLKVGMKFTVVAIHGCHLQVNMSSQI